MSKKPTYAKPVRLKPCPSCGSMRIGTVSRVRGEEPDKARKLRNPNRVEAVTQCRECKTAGTVFMLFLDRLDVADLVNKKSNFDARDTRREKIAELFAASQREWNEDGVIIAVRNEVEKGQKQ